MMDLSINDNALSINDNELSINDNALSINGNQLSIAGEMRLCTSSCRRWKSNSAGLERAGHGKTRHDRLGTNEKLRKPLFRRFTYGGSTGGWEALAVQLLYPEEFNGKNNGTELFSRMDLSKKPRVFPLPLSSTFRVHLSWADHRLQDNTVALKPSAANTHSQGALLPAPIPSAK